MILRKRENGQIKGTPYDIKPVGHKWISVKKRNKHGKIVRYKARLIAQGFSQRPE